jgi:hypothetical protein
MSQKFTNEGRAFRADTASQGDVQPAEDCGWLTFLSSSVENNITQQSLMLAQFYSL